MHRDTSDSAGFRRKVFPSQEPTASKYKNKDRADTQINMQITVTINECKGYNQKPFKFGY